MANAQSFMETMLTSPDATFGIMLVANAVYAADYGDFQSEDRRTREWREIADRLREQYGEHLTLPQVITEMKDAEFRRAEREMGI